MEENKNVKKWFSELEIVDTETGEIITKSEYYRRNLRIINKTKNYEITDEIGKIKHRWECKENEQQRLEL